MEKLILFLKKPDLSNVKVWNKKIRKWFSVKPKELTLFSSNINKCWNCGFHLKSCQCTNHISKIKKWIKKLKLKLKIKINTFLIKAEGYLYLLNSKFADKYYYNDKLSFDKYEKRSLKHKKLYISHRIFQEQHINWKNKQIPNFIIK